MILRKFNEFLSSDKDYLFLTAVICGFYPLVFYYSNNYFAINSIEHLLFFIAFFIGTSLAIFFSIYTLFGFVKVLKPYKRHALFFLCISITALLMSKAIFLMFNKKMLLIIWLLAFMASFKLYDHYKKIAILILLMSMMPLLKVTVFIYEDIKPKDWQSLPEDYDAIIFKDKPNIYLIQPDGYVSESEMLKAPYKHNSDLYSWLERHEFKVYDNFKSNYPASLASNASMFAMKQHQFGKTILPSTELPDARDVICGDNNALRVLKANGYHCNFIVEDEYFQQNRSVENYSYMNIEFSEIPFFSNDNNVKKKVFNDLKKRIPNSNTPSFFFVEKLLPHHVHFTEKENRLEKERKLYLDNIEEVNTWLKQVVTYLEAQDPNSIIIILADHGGWVGIESYDELFKTSDITKIKSIFSSLAAIKWNGYLSDDKDRYLKSNVNLFRILYSVLSNDNALLENLEDNSSYNLRTKKGYFNNSIIKCIDANGNYVL